MGFVGDIVDAGKKVGGWLFGGEGETGALGTGQYVVDKYQINDKAAEIPGAKTLQTQYSRNANIAQNRAAPQLDATQQAQFRNQQMSLADALTQQANGQGPSLAQGQLQQGTNRNLAQALALANSTRGAGSATALRDIQNQRAAIGQQAAFDASQLRMQEQMQARQQLSDVLNSGRGQDLQLAQNNTQAQLQQNQLNDAMTQKYLQLGFDLATARQKAAFDLEQLKVNQNMGYNQIQSGAFQNAAANRQQIAGQIIGAAGTAIGGGARGVPGVSGGGVGATATTGAVGPSQTVQL